MRPHQDDSGHARLRELLGPYVLGGLSAGDRRDLASHLDTCASCRDELAGYAGLPALLRAGASTFTGTVSHDAPLGGAVTALRARRRRHRLTLTAAAAAVLLAAVGGGAAIVLTSPEPAAASYAMASAPGVEATGEVSLRAKPWGTSLDLDLQDLPQDEVFVAWLVTAGGERQQVATWGSTDDGEAHLTGAGELGLEDVAAVRVTDRDGDVVLSAAAR